mmetsp:Transcript_25717/g.40288  ORF Transcript_25717/g.40288 Transcript_25717/m.40288 type:complete len:97 (+) Transcript_25717:205-495(+)
MSSGFEFWALGLTAVVDEGFSLHSSAFGVGVQGFAPRPRVKVQASGMGAAFGFRVQLPLIPGQLIRVQVLSLAFPSLTPMLCASRNTCFEERGEPG